ncbi:MAG: hypothetical protein HDR12_07845 [Lachnospiraceae bacterium]|nr:hypothetical protein [Lachnospiraceae bacterium]
MKMKKRMGMKKRLKLKERLKTYISQLVLTAMLVITFSIPVYAAVNGTYINGREGKTYYNDFDVPLYNGVVYTTSGANTSDEVYVNVTNASVNFVEVGIYPADSEYMINGRFVMETPGLKSFSSVHQYPNQHIRLGFCRTGITGEDNYVKGRYYYNGV